MKDFDNFLNFTDSTPRAILAVMGKHPAWNDHIDDFGISTPDLATLKRILYLRDIAENIDSGAWEAEASDKIFENFDNLFLWSKKDNHMIGAIWASVDGKGRDKYPMIAVIQCMGVRRAKIVADLPDLLKDIESKCKKLSKAEDVIKYLEGVQNSLNKWVEPDDMEITRLPQMAFSKPEIEKIIQSIVSDSRSCLHMRFLDKGDNPFLYADAARELFSGLPVLNIYRRDKGIIDIIVGEPDKRSIFSLKASLKSIPILDDLSFDSRMYENTEFQKAIKLISDGKPISLKGKSDAEISHIPLKRYAYLSAYIICPTILFVIILFGIFHFVSSSPEKEEANDIPEYSIEIKTNKSVEESPIEDVWKNLLTKTQGWVATTKNALNNKKILDAIRSNKELNDKFLMPFMYGAKKFNNYELSEIVDFGDVDLSYALEHPGNIIKRPSTQKKLREMLSLLLQIKSVQESWNGEKLFVEEIEWLKHDGFTSLNIKLPTKKGWIFKAAEISAILTKLDFIVRRTNEIDSIMPQLSSDAGFEKISSDFYKSRAQVKNLNEVEKLLDLDYSELSKALNFLKNEYSKRCNTLLFSKSEDFKNISAKTVDERIATILKYEKISPAENPIESIKFEEKKAKIEENLKLLSSIASSTEIEAYSKNFSALQVEYKKLQSIAQIAKNLNEIKNSTEVIEKQLTHFAEQLEQFTSERSNIKKWASNAKSIEISGDEVVQKLWQNFRNEYLNSLDLDSINKNLNLKLETIKAFNKARNKYETLSKNPNLEIKELTSFYFKEESLCAFNREKMEILKTYLNQENIDLQEIFSKLKKVAEKYLLADSALKRIHESLEYPNFATNSIIDNKNKESIESILANPTEKTLRIKTALENIKALKSINDAKVLLNFASNEKNEKTIRLEYYKKACSLPYLKGIENDTLLTYEALKKSSSEEMLKYLSDANFKLWKSALDFYRQKEIRNSDTAKLFALTSRFDLTDRIEKNAELRYENIIATKWNEFKNIKSEEDLRVVINEIINLLGKENNLDVKQCIDILKNFDASKALAQDEKSLSLAGPASVGWKPLNSTNANILKFEKDGVFLTFVLCAKEGKHSFYMQCNELSVDEFLKTTLASADKEKILSTLPDWKYEGFDDVNGPVAWILSEEKPSYKIRKNWITDANDVGNSINESPSKNSPMNWISFSGAKEFAKIVGCRLPTEEEYRIATELYDNSDSANLRDKKWTELFEKYKKQNTSTLAPRWQDGGIFDGDEKFPIGEKAVSIKEVSDNFAWFAPKSNQENIEHLYGNVWEYTSENTLFGYSALSAWKFSRENPFKKNRDENKYYCDVGMRLCFSAPTESPSRIFLNLLIQLPKYK